MRNKLLILSIFLGLFALSACSREENYRGVPAHLWEHLSGEQKQLIVDKAYQDEVVNPKTPG